MAHNIQIIVDGLVIGSTYSLVALGFSLVFGVLGVLNVAHADLYMLGAFVSVWIGADAGAGRVIGVLAAVAAGAIVGIAIYAVVVRRLSQAQMMAVFIATLGISFFLQNLVARIAGPETVPAPPLFHSVFHNVGGVAISDAQIVLVATTAVLGFGLIKWIGLSTLGRDMRSVSENAALARTVGVNVALVYVITMAVASAIAAIGGVLVTNVTQTVNPFLSNEIALKMFIVAIVAGAGSIGGVVFAGLALGIIESFTVAYVGSSWQHIVGLVILIVVLISRPQGLFGKSVRIG